MTDLTSIINAFIALCAALVTAFVIPWVKSKTTAQSRETLLTWVNIAVSAAEKLYKTTEAQEKKQYVLRFLANKGYDLNDEEIENTIEAEVLKLHTSLYGAEKA